MIFEDNIIKVLGVKKYNELLLFLDKGGLDFNDFKRNILIFYSVSFGLVFALFLFASLPLVVIVLSLFLLVPISVFVTYYYEMYKEDMRQKQIESVISDFLLQASLFPKGSDISTILKFVSNQDFGYLSIEFKIALDQINNGFSVASSLEGILKRNKNKILRRVINLLIIGYESGRDLSFVFSKLSKDLLKSQSIERDRYSGLAMQKYTLLISAGFLVPLVLAWVRNIVSSMDLSLFSSTGLINVNPKLIEYANIAIYIYLLEFAIISSIFVAIIDGNMRKAILYAIVLIPVSILIMVL